MSVLETRPSRHVVYTQVLGLLRAKAVRVKPSLAASLAARKLRLERMLEALEAGRPVELN